MNKEDCQKARNLFKKIMACIAVQDIHVVLFPAVYL